MVVTLVDWCISVAIVGSALAVTFIPGRIRRRRLNLAPRLTSEMLEAMREVDAMLPDSPPISPDLPAAERRTIEEAKKRERFLATLVPPSATAAGVYPRCNGAGGCGYHHRKGIPCGQALNERRPPPPPPQGPRFELVSESGRVFMRRSEATPPPPRPEPTRAPGPGIKASR